MSKFNIVNEAKAIAKILDRETAKLIKAENSVWQCVSARVLTVTIPSSASLADVKECFTKLGELVDGVSKKTWQTSYKSVLYAVAKHYYSNKIDTDGVIALSGKSLGELKKVVGWGPKPTAPTAPTAPKGNKDAVAPSDSLPPIGKVGEIKSLNDVYDSVLPSLELARDALIKFSASGAKVSKIKATALADLVQGINASLGALARIIE